MAPVLRYKLSLSLFRTQLCIRSSSSHFSILFCSSFDHSILCIVLAERDVSYLGASSESIFKVKWESTCTASAAPDESQIRKYHIEISKSIQNFSRRVTAHEISIGTVQSYPKVGVFILPSSFSSSLLNGSSCSVDESNTCTRVLPVIVLSQVSHTMISDGMLVEVRASLESALLQVCSIYSRDPLS